MRRILKLSLTCLAAGAVTACEVDTVIPTENIPTAGVRFINAVPDTAAMDFRFVDLVESNPHWNMGFRGSITTTGGVPGSVAIQYKGARAGARQYKIFMNGGCSTSSCDQSYASTVVNEGTINLTAGKNYTVIMWGYANPGRMDTTITNTNTPTPDTSITVPAGLPAGAPAMAVNIVEDGDQFGTGTTVDMRVINTTTFTVDVEAYTTTNESGTPTWTAVGPLSFSNYVALPTGTYKFDVENNAGGADLIATDATALVGSPAVTTAPGPFDAIPGTSVAGSAISAIIWPRSVAGSPAANSTSTSISFVWDRRPPRPDGV